MTFKGRLEKVKLYVPKSKNLNHFRYKLRKNAWSDNSSRYGPAGTPQSKRALVVLITLTVLIISIGAVASWRRRPINESASSPFSPPASPPPMAAADPAKEYIYAGSALIATEEPFRPAPDDLAVWRPSSGTWYIINSQQQWTSYQFGIGTDIPITEDFDGDGKTDFCVFRPSTGDWHIVRSSASGYYAQNFGLSTDTHVSADFDGDGKGDIAVFRSSNSYCYIINSNNSSISYVLFGASGDKPVPADFDGDGRAEAAVCVTLQRHSVAHTPIAGWIFNRPNRGQTRRCRLRR